MAKETFDEMMHIVKCRHCGGYEYYGEMRWLNGRCECRSCYKHHREEIDHKPYGYTDLDGPRPTEKDFLEQEDEFCACCGGRDCTGCEHQHVSDWPDGDGLRHVSDCPCRDEVRHSASTKKKEKVRHVVYD